MSCFLSIKEFEFSYGQQMVLQGINLELLRGEILCIMGPSGYGKTTLLRVLAGLEDPDDSGVAAGIFWENGQRPLRTGVVFQEPRLVPWRSVEQNLWLSLQSLPAVQRTAAIRKIPELMDAMGILDCLRMLPETLSGGMRQRVALVRALLFGQELQLWDEPFQNLDQALRMQCLKYVRQVWKTHQTSALVVTHDLAEAQALADRLIIWS